MNIAFPNQLRNFPSLAKEGWRAAPGWFETAIPQLREERYIYLTKILPLFIYPVSLTLHADPPFTGGLLGSR